MVSNQQQSVYLYSSSLYLVITHTGSILEYMHGTVAHILMNGELRCSDDEQALFSIIEKDGFEYELKDESDT